MTAPFTFAKGAYFGFCATFTIFIHKNRNICAICGFPIPPIPGPGRPQPYIISHPPPPCQDFFQKSFSNYFKKTIAICFWICYNIRALRERHSQESKQKNLKKFEKTLDKPFQMCYNIRAVREWGAHHELTAKLKNLILKGIDYYD